MARLSHAQMIALYKAIAAYEGEPFRTLADACTHFSEIVGFTIATKAFRTTMLECEKSLITHAHFGKPRPRREEATDVDARLDSIQNQIAAICRTIGMLQTVDNTLSSRAAISRLEIAVSDIRRSDWNDLSQVDDGSIHRDEVLGQMISTERARIDALEERIAKLEKALEP